ncbi:MAG: response regulator [Planctomycetota bacterium]
MIQIVDDDDRDRASLVELVSSLGHQYVTYNRPDEFLDAVDPRVPGCVMLDICMPGLTGFDVLERLRARGILLPVIFLSAFADIRMAVRALTAGATGFLEKPYAAHEIVQLMNKALCEDEKSRHLFEHFQSLKTQMDLLTERESEVVTAILAGDSNKEIASRLEISNRTVESHRSNIMEKLDVRSVVGLVKVVLEYQSLRDQLDEIPR